ncbi:DUF4245 family protein [Microbacterium sp. ZW T5_56]|uniref:DUF4245 family protein n=1 Tax=Microbacterium sp. ZW T5_56 TaxID=3378081 RepID=UPI003852E908
MARVVAELGRPETPQETADRKAASSAAYRGSQNFRNLIAALIVTMLIVLVIVWVVPRGTAPEIKPADPVKVAAMQTNASGQPTYAIDAPKNWWSNVAIMDSFANYSLFNASYVPTEESKLTGFVRLNDVYNADDRYAQLRVPGALPEGTETLGGREWTVFTIPDVEKAGNVTQALGTQVDDDYVLLYGKTTDELIREFATQLATTIEKETAQ